MDAIAASREQRQADRTIFRVSVRSTIHPAPGGNGRARVCHLLTQDLSETGIGIVYARPLSEGQFIELELLDGTRTAVVCRVTNLSDGHYLAGCCFTTDGTAIAVSGSVPTAYVCYQVQTVDSRGRNELSGGLP